MVLSKQIAPASCSNCGTPLADRYCGRCGQDAHVTLSIGHFIGEFIEGIFHFDSTFWRTFLPLVFKPGLLTEQYLDGKRKSFAPPLRSYLVLSLLYFLIASIVTSSHSRVMALNGREVRAQDCAQFASTATWLGLFVTDVEGRCTRALTDEGHTFSSAVNATLPKVMFAVLPLVALVQYWLNRRQRAMYVESLIFVLHFQSFYFLVGSFALLLTASIGAMVGAGSAAGQNSGEWLDFLLYAWSAYYLFVANRRTYHSGKVKAVVTVAMMAIAYTVFWALGVTIAALYQFAHA